MKTLEVAIEAGFDATEVGSDPSFEGLRADPRFLALVNAQPRPQVPVMPVVVPPTYEVAGSSPHKHALNQSGIELMRRASMTGRSPRSRRKSDSGSTNAMYNIACAYSLRGDKRRAFDALQRAIENGFDNSQHMTQDEDLRLLQETPTSIDSSAWPKTCSSSDRGVSGSE